jgi:hypothetical protein
MADQLAALARRGVDERSELRGGLPRTFSPSANNIFCHSYILSAIRTMDKLLILKTCMNRERDNPA